MRSEAVNRAANIGEWIGGISDSYWTDAMRVYSWVVLDMSSNNEIFPALNLKAS